MTSFRRIIRSTLLASIVGAAASIFISPLTSLRAQTTEANLSGVLYDTSGSVVPGAKVDLVNKERGATRSTTSNASGAYEFPFIQPGTYDVTVAISGFKGLRQEGVALAAAQNVRLNLTLAVGGASETISVSSAPPDLDTATAVRSEVIGAEKAEELPLNGRSFTSLPLLAPGVTPPAQGSSNALRGGFNVSGSGDASNYFILNGLDDNDSVTATPLFRPSVDALEEMNVLTGQYPAQYGFLSGGQIVMAIKSGTNRFHGSLFEYIRNSAVITARNYFQTTQPEYNRNQFGGTVGGPIHKNKAFFFFSYEGLRLSQSIPITSTVPTLAMRAGDFSGLPSTTIIKDPLTGVAFPGNMIPASRISAIGAALLALYPAPTSSTAAGVFPANNYFWSPIRPEQDDTFSTKIDYTLSSSDSAYISVNNLRQSAHEPIGRTGCNGGSQLPNLGCQLTYKADVYGASETHIFSQSLVNQIYAGFSLGQQPYAADGTKIDFFGQFGYHPRTSMPLNLSPTSIPNTTLTGFTSIQAGSQYRRDPRSQITDTLSWTLGRHSLTMGYNYSNLPAAYVRNIPPSGTLAFTNSSAGPTSGYSIADALLGYPASTTFTSNVLEQNFIYSSSAAYAQDSYKLSSNLSLNFGLRWEFTPPLAEKHNYLNSFDPTTGTPIAANTNGYGNHVYNDDFLDFAPRIGFAWQPYKSGLTSVRGGFGTYYSRIPAGSQTFLIWGQYPFTTLSTYTSSKTQPVTLANPFPSSNTVTTIALYGVQKTFVNPRTYQWSFGLQQQLPLAVVADLAYIGSSSQDQLIGPDINQATPGAGTPAQVNARRPFLGFGTSTFYQSAGTGSYHSLQSKLSRNFSKGLSFTAAYTFSHSIDNTAQRTNQYDPSTGKGSSYFDIRHRFVLSGVYGLPLGKDRQWLNHGFVSYVVSGWQLTPIFQVETGQPLTPTLSGNFSNSGGDVVDRPNVVANPNNNAPHTINAWFNTSAFQVPVASGQAGATYTFGNAGVGIIGGPGFESLDVSLARNIKIRDTTSLQIRMQVFNMFNHPNFGLPALVANTSTFGTISSANDPRLSEFAVRLTF